MQLAHPEVKMVYYDVGGVLARLSGGWQALAEMFNIAVPVLKSTWLARDASAYIGKKSGQNLWQETAEEFGYPGKDIDFARFWASYFEVIDEGHQILRATAQVVAVGLLTNVYPDMHHIGYETGIIPNVPYVAQVLSCEQGTAKPDPAIFLRAAALAKEDPQHILLVDDRLENIAAARSLGWQGVVFNSDDPQVSVGEIEELLDLVDSVDSMGGDSDLF